MKNKALLKITPGSIIQTIDDGIVVVDKDGLQYEQDKYSDYYYFYDVDGNYYSEADFVKILHHYPFLSNKKDLTYLIENFDKYMLKNEKSIETSLGKVSSHYGYDIIEIKKLEESFYTITAAMKERSILENDEIRLADRC